MAELHANTSISIRGFATIRTRSYFFQDISLPRFIFEFLEKGQNVHIYSTHSWTFFGRQRWKWIYMFIQIRDSYRGKRTTRRRNAILETRLQLLLFCFFLNKFQRAITIEFKAIWILPARWKWLSSVRAVFILKNNHLRLHSSTRAVSWPQIKSMVDGWIDLRVIDTIRNNNSCSAFFLSYSCFFSFFFLLSVYLYISIQRCKNLFSVVYIGCYFESSYSNFADYLFINHPWN